MTNKFKKCPFCGEEILAVAIKCKFCESMLQAEQVNNFKPQGKKRCPFCGEEIPADDVKCSFCESDLLTIHNNSYSPVSINEIKRLFDCIKYNPKELIFSLINIFTILFSFMLPWEYGESGLYFMNEDEGQTIIWAMFTLLIILIIGLFVFYFVKQTKKTQKINGMILLISGIIPLFLLIYIGDSINLEYKRFDFGVFVLIFASALLIIHGLFKIFRLREKHPLLIFKNLSLKSLKILQNLRRELKKIHSVSKNKLNKIKTEKHIKNSSENRYQKVKIIPQKKKKKVLIISIILILFIFLSWHIVSFYLKAVAFDRRFIEVKKEAFKYTDSSTTDFKEIISDFTKSESSYLGIMNLLKYEFEKKYKKNLLAKIGPSPKTTEDEILNLINTMENRIYDLLQKISSLYKKNTKQRKKVRVESLKKILNKNISKLKKASQMLDWHRDNTKYFSNIYDFIEKINRFLKYSLYSGDIERFKKFNKRFSEVVKSDEENLKQVFLSTLYKVDTTAVRYQLIDEEINNNIQFKSKKYRLYVNASGEKLIFTFYSGYDGDDTKNQYSFSDIDSITLMRNGSDVILECEWNCIKYKNLSFNIMGGHYDTISERNIKRLEFPAGSAENAKQMLKSLRRIVNISLEKTEEFKNIKKLFFKEFLLDGQRSELSDSNDISSHYQEIITKHWTNAITTESGLKYVVLREGSGEKPIKGDKVKVLYVGILLSGRKIGSSVDRDKPFEFKVGIDMVIKGWDEAILDMRKGEERFLIIPPELGYGQRSIGIIPQNSTLIFEIKLLDILTQQDEGNLNYSLIAHYPFNGNSNDESGNGNHGNVYGATITDDRFGDSNKAFYFNGINNFIEISDHERLRFKRNESFTIAAWIKIDGIYHENIHFISKMGSDKYHPGWYMMRVLTNSGNLSFGVGGNNRNQAHIPNGSADLKDKKWHYVVGILNRDDDKLYQYVDGKLDGFVSLVKIGSLDNNRSLIIGKRGDNVGMMKGKLDEIKIYNRALTKSEILDLFTKKNI